MPEKTVPARNKADIDGGWAWAVMVACYSGALIVGIITYMGGVINMALLQEYHGDKAKTALIGALNTGLSNMFGPLASVVANLFSCRVSIMICGVITTTAFVSSAFADSLDVLLVTYGILGGIGFIFGLVFVVAIGFYFEKRRNHLMGYLHTMYGVGMIVSSPLALFLIETCGLRDSLIVMGCITLQICVVAMIVAPSSIEIELQNRRRTEQDSCILSALVTLKKSFQFSVLKNIPFLLFLLSLLAWNFLMSVCLVNLPNYMRIKGSSSSQIGVQMFVFGCGSLAGRLLSASIIGSEAIDAMLLYIGMLGVGGVVTSTFPWYSKFVGGDIFFAVMAGLYTGGPNAMMTSISVDFVGIAKLSAANGLTFFFCGSGYMAAGPIAGFSYGLSGTYDNIFYISGCFNLVGCCLAMLSVVLKGIKPSTKEEEKLHCTSSGAIEVEIVNSGSKSSLTLKERKSWSGSSDVLELTSYVSGQELTSSFTNVGKLIVPKLHKSVEYISLKRSEVDKDCYTGERHRSADDLKCITSPKREGVDVRNTNVEGLHSF